MSSVKDYAAGLASYLQKKFSSAGPEGGIDLNIQELKKPLLKLGTDTGIYGSYDAKKLEFYAGFSEEKAGARLKFYFQLQFPKGTPLSEALEARLTRASSKTVKSLSRILGQTNLRFNASETDTDIFSAYCEVKDPKHIRPNDLYQEIWTYLMREPMALASGFKQIRQ